MATIVYLDADDEITSAAARMRSAGEAQVGLVVPYGSRLATSRINFRLLAREAQSRDRQLAIIAGDAATRALAASAGLAVHATVGEYEAAAASESGGSPSVAPPAAEPRPTRARAARVPPRAPTPEPAPKPEPEPDLEATAIAPISGPIVVPPPAATRTPAEASRGRSIKVVGPRRGFSRPAMLVGAAVLILIVIVGGVGAYVFLPSATITVTPRVEAMIPVSFEVRADPAVGAPDPSAGVVPAQRIAIPVGVTGTFPASGRRIEETKAGGTVRFTSENTFVPVTIPAGTRVSTASGIAFSTREAVTVERASFITGPTSASVGVDAQVTGPGGNVGAGTITELSDDIRQFLISVTNPEATSGGTRTEFPRVEQADVDAALAELAAQLAAQFDERLADPATVPPATTLFPATAALGPSTPSGDPAALVGTEVPTFDLGLTAEGSVTAVDERPLEEIARSRIRGAVDGDHRLVDDSIEVRIGDPIVDGATVVFPLTATASQVLVLDAEALLAAVKGRPIPQARAILEPYGSVRLEVWPDWVTAIPTLDDRVNLVVDDGLDGEPESSPSPRPSTSPPVSNSAAPADSSPSGAP